MTATTLLRPPPLPTRRTQLWQIPEAHRTGGLNARPAEYQQRTTAFLDRALGL